MTDEIAEASAVTGRRALLTEREREVLADPAEDGRLRAQKISKIRRRVRENIETDIELLAQHDPELLGEIREVVCEEENRSSR